MADGERLTFRFTSVDAPRKTPRVVRNHMFVIEAGKVVYVDEWMGTYAGGEITDEAGRLRAMDNARKWNPALFAEMQGLIKMEGS